MKRYQVTCEANEDTFDSTDNFDEAVRIARQVAQDWQPGDLIWIEHAGMAIRQFVKLSDGSISEEDCVAASPLAGS